MDCSLEMEIDERCVESLKGCTSFLPENLVLRIGRQTMKAPNTCRRVPINGCQRDVVKTQQDAA